MTHHTATAIGVYHDWLGYASDLLPKWTDVQTVGPSPRRDVAVAVVLEQLAATLRAEYPAVFEAADAIKLRPGRRPFDEAGRGIVADLSRVELRECLWCGDDFVAYRKKPNRCCSQPCSQDLRKWQRTRARLER